MTEEDVDIDVSWRDETLAGTLHQPTSWSGAVVLMMQGSGPSDRDAEGYFAPIRAAFVERGIATYYFDKPGCGASTGDWRRHALSDRADQATAVLHVLADQPEIDQLGVWGQSQGGWLVQIVAAVRPDLAFAIANSGPSISVVEQNLYGCEHTMRSSGQSDAAVTTALAHMAAIHAAAARGATYDEVEATLLAPARGKDWASYFDVIDEHDWSGLLAFVGEAYEPAPTLRRIRCPFLAVFGGLDILVPAWRGARETGESLVECPDATVTVFPHADHRIQIDGPLDFAPGYLDLIGDWAAARLRRAG
jgi:pimeloyl-ACP methyl ester carboxylesterase